MWTESHYLNQNNHLKLNSWKSKQASPLDICSQSYMFSSLFPPLALSASVLLLPICTKRIWMPLVDWALNCCINHRCTRKLCWIKLSAQLRIHLKYLLTTLSFLCRVKIHSSDYNNNNTWSGSYLSWTANNCFIAWMRVHCCLLGLILAFIVKYSTLVYEERLHKYIRLRKDSSVFLRLYELFLNRFISPFFERAAGEQW